MTDSNPPSSERAPDWVNVSHVLAEEYVGLEEIDEGEWEVYFGRRRLGRFHEPLGRIEDAQGRLARKRAQVQTMYPDYSVNDLSGMYLPVG